MRIQLQAYGDPPPDATRLVKCTDRTRTITEISNAGDDVWLTQPPVDIPAVQLGAPPAAVLAFREFAAKFGPGGYFLEPGTSVSIPAPPDSVGLVVDSANQGRWATYSILVGGAAVASERLPDLIRRPEARSAVANCIETGKRFVDVYAKSQYNTSNLIDYLGLGAKTTECSSGLLLAEKERQAEALARTGRTLPELKPATFAGYANQIAGYLDNALKYGGSLAKAL